MSGKELQLLEQQLEKIEAKEFDLKAWKKYTIVILARIFANQNEKVRQIDTPE